MMLDALCLYKETTNQTNEPRLSPLSNNNKINTKQTNKQQPQKEKKRKKKTKKKQYRRTNSLNPYQNQNGSNRLFDIFILLWEYILRSLWVRSVVAFDVSIFRVPVIWLLNFFSLTQHIQYPVGVCSSKVLAFVNTLNCTWTFVLYVTDQNLSDMNTKRHPLLRCSGTGRTTCLW